MDVTGSKKPNVKKLMGMLSISTLILSLAFLFGNCSQPQHGEMSEQGSSGLQTGTCSLSGPEQLFMLTYSPILQRQCASCHIPGGRGKGVFASPGLALAFDAFSLVGYKRISEMAVNANHNPPYTGPVNGPDIAEATKTWELGVKELTTCKTGTIKEFVDDTWKDVRVYLKSKAINPSTSGDVQVRWNIGSENLALPSGVTWPAAPGAVFEITVRTTPNGASSNYTLFRPRIIYPTSNPAAVDLQLQSLRIRINGTEVINETTFHYMNAGARKNEDTMLSAGGMVALGTLKTTDLISVSFGKVEQVTLPPAPPAPSIQWSMASQTTQERGRVSVTATLSQPVDAFVTASYSTNVGAGTARVPCCSSIRNSVGQPVDVKNFDRDFIPVNRDGGTIVFEPNITSKTIDIDIVDDERDEADETIVLKIDSVTVGNGTGQVGANSTHTITIQDDDNAPGPYEVTFSTLMAPGGAFMRYCIRCHHATADDVLAREYDMTTYTDLLARNRVVKGKPNESLLWGRIQGSWQGSAIEPMPQGGLFDTDGLQAQDEIKNWILSGAKNN